jgi:hypothetical protein
MILTLIFICETEASERGEVNSPVLATFTSSKIYPKKNYRPTLEQHGFIYDSKLLGLLTDAKPSTVPSPIPSILNTKSHPKPTQLKHGQTKPLFGDLSHYRMRSGGESSNKFIGHLVQDILL